MFCSLVSSDVKHDFSFRKSEPAGCCATEDEPQIWLKALDHGSGHTALACRNKKIGQFGQAEGVRDKPTRWINGAWPLSAGIKFLRHNNKDGC